MRFWKITSLICLTAAIAQCYEVAGCVAHIATIGWKTGIEPGLITAGWSMIVIFFVLTVAFTILGMLAADRLSKVSSSLRFCSLLSAQLLLCGALIWGCLLCTPLVQVVSR